MEIVRRIHGRKHERTHGRARGKACGDTQGTRGRTQERTRGRAREARTSHLHYLTRPRRGHPPTPARPAPPPASPIALAPSNPISYAAYPPEDYIPTNNLLHLPPCGPQLVVRFLFLWNDACFSLGPASCSDFKFGGSDLRFDFGVLHLPPRGWMETGTARCFFWPVRFVFFSVRFWV